MTTTLSKQQIIEIAEQLDCGFRCFWNRKNNELLFVPDLNRNPGMDNDLFADDFEKLDNNFGDYDEIEPLQSNDAFQIMADFTQQLSDSNSLKNKLTVALTNKKPFSQFKITIDNSATYRQQWFDFKADKIQQWVLTQINQLKRG